MESCRKASFLIEVAFVGRFDYNVKATDKGGAVVVWRADLYQKEASRPLSDTSFYDKVNKDLTLINQTIVKNTIYDLIAKQELPATAKNHHSQNFEYLLFTQNPQTKQPRSTHRFCMQLSHRSYFQLFRQNYGTYRQNFTILH